MRLLLITLLSGLALASCKKDKTKPDDTIAMPQPTYAAPSNININSTYHCFNDGGIHWDSTLLRGQLIGSWLWIQAYEYDDNSAKYSSIPAEQSKLIRFNSDQTVDIYVNGKKIQTSNWTMIVNYAPNYWKLQIDNYEELSSCVFIFCDNTMLFISGDGIKDHNLFEKIP